MARFDHLIVAVTRLAAASVRWSEALSTPVVRAGRHPYGTENALALFAADCYLELITGPTGGGNTWLDILATPGPVTFALSTGDLDGDLGRLRAAGFPTTDAVPGERALPNGGSVRWRSALLGGDTLSRSWPFLIEWPSTGAARLGLEEPRAPLSLQALELAAPDPPTLVRLLHTLGWTAAGGGASRVTDGTVALTVHHGAPSGPSSLTLRGASADAELTLDGVAVRVRTSG
jgi:hypothetical protein